MATSVVMAWVAVVVWSVFAAARARRLRDVGDAWRSLLVGAPPTHERA